VKKTPSKRGPEPRSMATLTSAAAGSAPPAGPQLILTTWEPVHHPIAHLPASSALVCNYLVGMKIETEFQRPRSFCRTRAHTWTAANKQTCARSSTTSPSQNKHIHLTRIWRNIVPGRASARISSMPGGQRSGRMLLERYIPGENLYQTQSYPVSHYVYDGHTA
jgi:hypothetical protein